MTRIMERTFVLCVITCMSFAVGGGRNPAVAEDRHADAAYVPPASKALLEAGLDSIAPEQVQAYIDRVDAYHVFALYEGRNEELKIQNFVAGVGPLKGGEVVELDLAAPELFGTPVANQEIGVPGVVYLASITSLDAQGIRLRADLTGLRPGDEAWVIDPVLLRAFGPYTAANQEIGVPGERWLATIHGDEAILMVRTASKEPPAIRLTGYSHIFLSLLDVAKQLECNHDIACETDPAILAASSGTAIIMTSDASGSWFCSGTLVNNELTAELEPFFLTANHCVCTRAETQSMEVYWDFRSSACGVNDAPAIDTLPRSNGAALLVTDSKLDATLIRLDSVPDGTYGRTYLGWDNRLLKVDDAIMAIHYPVATHMRISKGLVIGVGDALNGRKKQTNVHWDEGVTEGGSSGSCLLLAENNRITGMLSQGTEHSCVDNTNNVDWFASFHEFYPEVSKYLDSASPSTDEGKDNCLGSTKCPFLASYQGNPEMLNDFRVIRDKMLRTSDAGSKAVDLYYACAPYLARIIQKSDEARCVFISLTARFAPIGALLR